jgi:hypothetical protein
VAAGGGVTLRWGKPVTVVSLPVWLSYQRCTRLLELDRAQQAAHVQLPGGPLKQVSSGGGVSEPRVQWDGWLPAGSMCVAQCACCVVLQAGSGMLSWLCSIITGGQVLDTCGRNQI